MVVAAHPHTGLQTVTWLLEGSVEHRDSVGTVQHIEPGQLNLMTAGRGIAHSELSIGKDGTTFEGNMHGVQLWVALPDHARNMQPFFEHHADLPVFEHNRAQIKLLVGTWLDHTAATRVFTPLLGAELTIGPTGQATLPLTATFEHVVMPLTGDAQVDGQQIPRGGALYLEPQASESGSDGQFTVVAAPGTEVLLLGGEPFPEPIVMWWNFIGRTHEEIVEFRERWNAQDGWTTPFSDRVGGWIPAPELPNVRIKSR